ncbi:hypothetical protein [Halomicrococcus gelatinilyticus]|uniref:hypothetical protein n=1 Tax=Halomicrococcus gelatinilyticus TaxID=1702103 RepID=UPI002E102DE9
MNGRTTVAASRERSADEPSLPTNRTVVDVSEMATSEVAAYARASEDREVYLERKGGRTLLVAAP